MKRFWKLLIILLSVLGIAAVLFASGGGESAKDIPIPRELNSYGDSHMKGLWDILVNRVEKEPFNLFATLIFLLAIVHTFLTSKFMSIAHYLKHKHEHNKQKGKGDNVYLNMGAEVFHFLGEVEAVFGIWAVVLAWTMVAFYGWDASIGYLTVKVDYTEPVFVVVIMSLAATRPVVKFAELMMWRIANLMGGMLTAWWLTILTIGPILGSFITEPAAMTISALLLSEKFYKLEPSDGFKYATIGLLFVNISVGGTLTNFAAPPVLMVVNKWHWSMDFLFLNYGWKAVIGILMANGFYYFMFRKEMEDLQKQYAIIRFQRELQSQFVQKKDLEASLVKIGTIARRELGFAEAFHKKCEDIKKDMQNDLDAKMADKDVDKDQIKKAFAQEFEESKWKVMGRLFPGLMPSEERPPFIDPDWDKREDRVPFWIMLVHIAFMIWVITNLHHPPLFIAAFLFFLGFSQVTSHYQNNIDLKPALLVGFFLGGLVIHGKVQSWWIAPVLSSLSEIPLFLGATLLTAFNDNAAITYLSTQVPNFSEALKYAVVAGAVTGGGLTVIANAPNPAGQSILKKHFFNGVNPMKLAISAIIPTIIMGLCFMLLRF